MRHNRAWHFAAGHAVFGRRSEDMLTGSAGLRQAEEEECNTEASENAAGKRLAELCGELSAHIHIQNGAGWGVKLIFILGPHQDNECPKGPFGPECITKTH